MYTTGLLSNISNHYNAAVHVLGGDDELFNDSCDQAGGNLSGYRSQRCLSMTDFESHGKPQEYNTPGTCLATPNALYVRRERIQKVAYRMSTFPDVEPQSTLKGNGIVDITHHLYIISWHDHLGAIFGVIWPMQSSGFICMTDQYTVLQY